MSAAAMPPPLSTASSLPRPPQRVRLELHAARLANAAGAFRGTSDPYAVVTVLAGDPAGARPAVLGRTEAVRSCLSPRWVAHFELDYRLGELTRVNVGVYDDRGGGPSPRPMGAAVFEVGDVLASRGNLKAKQLRPGGTLFARVVPAAAPPPGGGAGWGQLHLRLQGHRLTDVDAVLGLRRRCDAFLEISYRVTDNAAGGLAWQPVYRSEPVPNDRNPRWPAFRLDLDRLCGGDRRRAVQIKVLDWRKNGQHAWLGTFETSVEALLAAVVAEPMEENDVDTSKAFHVMKRGKLEAGKVIVTEAWLENGDATVGAPSAAASTFASSLPAQSFSGSSPVPSAYMGPTAAALSYTQPPTAYVTTQPTIPAAVLTAAAPSYTQPPAAYGTSAPTIPVAALGAAPSYVQPVVAYATSTPTVQAGRPTSAPYVQPHTAYAASAQTVQATSSVAPSGTMALSLPATASGPPAPAPMAPPAPLEPQDSASRLPPPVPPPAARPTLVDYLSGGLAMELCLAVDFTGSNGDPRVPGTLHHQDPGGRPNDYEKAIVAVGGILARYSATQRFPVWGFGAKFGGQIQHCFQVGKESELHGISGALEAYRHVFESGLIMSAPTVFAEVIHSAAAKARSANDVASKMGQQKYTILLILTDGEVSDINLTKEALNAASDAPLSVVIVGIGTADFSSMYFFDNFQANAGSKKRDICKFVEFNRYQDNKQVLARETLQEIPDQLVEYFWSRGIKPLPPVSGNDVNIVADAPTDEDVELDLSFGPDGQISLANDSGAVYDDTKYNVLHNHLSTPASSAPNQPHSTTSSAYSASKQPYISNSTTATEATLNPSSSIGVARGPYVLKASTGASAMTFNPSASLPIYRDQQSALPLHTASFNPSTSLPPYSNQDGNRPSYI